ncbi:phage tail protein [Streptomyces chartreusis]|uniref:phage tail protein n=1 Tax=Streptomyces chartreusis TaxID=1969 RepID=UPI003403CFA4
MSRASSLGKSINALGKAAFGQVSMSHQFLVEIDNSDYDLGTWSSVSGLSVSWQSCEFRDGENWNHSWIYPGLPQYPKVKLSRAACEDSQIVQDWLVTTSRRNEPQTGAISLIDWLGMKVVSWELKEFFPAAWGIGEFDAGASRVALETLELIHTGFLGDEFQPGGVGKPPRSVH